MKLGDRAFLNFVRVNSDEARTKTKWFRVKWCSNNTCTRTYWNRDVNAAINVLNLFLELCHAGSRNSKFTRQNKTH